MGLLVRGDQVRCPALSVAGLRKCDPVPAGYHIEAVRECVRLSTFPSPCHPLEIVGHIEVDPPRVLLGPEPEPEADDAPAGPAVVRELVIGEEVERWQAIGRHTLRAPSGMVVRER